MHCATGHLHTYTRNNTRIIVRAIFLHTFNAASSMHENTSSQMTSSKEVSERIDNPSTLLVEPVVFFGKKTH